MIFGKGQVYLFHCRWLTQCIFWGLRHFGHVFRVCYDNPPSRWSRYLEHSARPLCNGYHRATVQICRGMHSLFVCQSPRLRGRSWQIHVCWWKKGGARWNRRLGNVLAMGEEVYNKSNVVRARSYLPNLVDGKSKPIDQSCQSSQNQGMQLQLWNNRVQMLHDRSAELGRTGHRFVPILGSNITGTLPKNTLQSQ